MSNTATVEESTEEEYYDYTKKNICLGKVLSRKLDKSISLY